MKIIQIESVIGGIMYDDILKEYKLKNYLIKLLKKKLLILFAVTIIFSIIIQIFNLSIIWLILFAFLLLLSLFIGIKEFGKKELKIKSNSTVKKIISQLFIHDDDILRILLLNNELDSIEKITFFKEYLDFYFEKNKEEKKDWSNVISTFIAIVFDLYTKNGDDFNISIQLLLYWIIFKILISSFWTIIQVFQGKYDLYNNIKNSANVVYFDMCQKRHKNSGYNVVELK